MGQICVFFSPKIALKSIFFCGHKSVSCNFDRVWDPKILKCRHFRHYPSKIWAILVKMSSFDHSHFHVFFGIQTNGYTEKLSYTIEVQYTAVGRGGNCGHPSLVQASIDHHWGGASWTNIKFQLTISEEEIVGHISRYRFVDPVSWEIDEKRLVQYKLIWCIWFCRIHNSRAKL